MFACRIALLISPILLMVADQAVAQQAAGQQRWISAYDAQVLAGAPITRPAVIRNYGPVDLGGSGTRVGNGDQPAIDLYSRQNSQAQPQPGPEQGDEPAVDTALYPYYNPSFIGYGNYTSFAGFGYGGHPYGGYGYPSQGSGYPNGGAGAAYGWTNYPPWLYRPRYFYPYRYYPLRTGFSVYNPYFNYNNTWYGRYSNPAWSGYGGFAFPYNFGAFGSGGAGYNSGAFGSGGAGYNFGGFGYPYRYGVFGYPYPGLYNQTWAYQPSQAYFVYPGMGGLYVPPGFYGFPGYYGYAGYGMGLANPPSAGAFYW